MKSAKIYVITILLFILSLSATPLQAGEKVGILLMHGKWGTSKLSSPIGKLSYSLKQKGFIVISPTMPWSKQRKYDKTFDESMAEIDEYVEKLRKKGATKIVVGGHSMGANAALGYGARREGLSGIIAIAPGHVPERMGFQNMIDNDWIRAQKMVDAGKGNQKDKFNDLNMETKRKVKMRAEVYLSWFDPSGPARMPVNTAKLKPGTPLLWIIGKKDRIMSKAGKYYAYVFAPSNPKNAYIVVGGGHLDTPEKGKAEIINWINNL